MVWDKTRLINTLDRIIIFSLYSMALLFPISKAAIEICSTLAIVCYVLKMFLRKESLPRSYLNSAILVYLGICFVSVFTSVNYGISARTFYGKIVQNVLFFFVLIDALNSEKKIRNFLYIMFFSSAVVGIDGIYQYFTHKDFLRHRPAIFVKRIYASFLTPNDFGCYLIAVMPFLVTFLVTKLRSRTGRLLLGGLFFLLFTCLMMTVSRGAWYGFAASALFLGLWIYHLGLFFLLLAFFITVTHPFYPALIKERLNNFFVGFDVSCFKDPGSVERKIFWEAGWKMFIVRPWIGLGLGTFMFNFKDFVPEAYQYGPSYAHNCYLQMLAEMGAVGLVSFLVIPALFFYSGIRIISKNNRSFSWYILLASLAALLGYCVQMGVDTIFYSLDLGLLFWILLGLGVSAMSNIKSEVVTPK
ncbi:MAG: O-antigen ligase family protein [Candidatus Omnitrophota bacterium]